MAVLLKEMQDLNDQVIEDYYKKAVSTNQFMGRNFEMALRLQRQWRMQKIRKKYLDTRKAAVTIQRHIRMYLGLKRVQDLKFIRQDEWNMKFFDFHAVLIQKVYFGYMSRKYIHSFYARQENLARTAKEEEKVRKMMQEYLRDLENTKKVTILSTSDRGTREPAAAFQEVSR